MSYSDQLQTDDSVIPSALRRFVRNRMAEVLGLSWLAATAAITAALSTWSITDPSRNNATENLPQNILGMGGAVFADELIQFFGLATIIIVALLILWPLRLIRDKTFPRPVGKTLNGLAAACCTAAFLSCLPVGGSWVLSSGYGGSLGDMISATAVFLSGLMLGKTVATILTALLFAGMAGHFLLLSFGRASIIQENAFLQIFRKVGPGLDHLHGLITHHRLYHMARARRQSRTDYVADEEIEMGKPGWVQSLVARLKREDDENVLRVRYRDEHGRIEPTLSGNVGPKQNMEMPEPGSSFEDDEEVISPGFDPIPIETRAQPIKQSKKMLHDMQPAFSFDDSDHYQLPPLTLLGQPKKVDRPAELSNEALEQNARMLEGVLEDFGVRGEIINVRPGPVVTLYELEPAPGIKSSRVIGLADDIARSMSAISARVAVVPGRNVIGIELPNSTRETVYLREMLGSTAYEKSKHALAMALGKNIGGEPIFADLARMPHLLIAGTTGSGKSVGINTMILSLLYRHSPETCKLIMIDPKMLELSVYEGIPHLLAPVVTDPRKAVVALKWAVREMEDRYRLMSKLGVRNVDGFNAKVKENLKSGTAITRTVQTGYDPETGEPVYETEEIEIKPMPYIVVIIDEMADLMMVAGKDIEGAVQRLAQMARAAGIHVVMATQRPSVDVITGTIKANFPTRISFQVTSKIDSRTILGEQGAEHLLGQGDMLYMAGGGRISRLHGPFVSDGEVEEIVSFLKTQGTPQYVEAVTEETDDDIGGFDLPGAAGNSGDDLYDKAVAVVLRDKKVSTSYIQRRLQIGYNRAASLIERMETEGLISAANHAGKREILVGDMDGSDTV